VGEDFDGRGRDGEAGQVAQIQGLAAQAEVEGELAPWHWLDVTVSFILSYVALYTPSYQSHWVHHGK